MRPSAPSPSKNFTERSNCEHKLPPCAISNRCEGMQEHAQAEENTERDASSERRSIAIGGGMAVNWCNADVAVYELGDCHLTTDRPKDVKK